MHITGIIDDDHTTEVLEAIRYFLNAENRKVSVTAYGDHISNKEAWYDYRTALFQAGTEILIVRIKAQHMNACLDTVPMNTLIVNDYTQWSLVTNKMNQKKKNFSKDLVVILNCDVIKPLNFSDDKKCRLLKYGFSSESNITTSSTGEPSIGGKFLCCIRQGIRTCNGATIEPQEFVVNLIHMTEDPYNILAAASYAVLHDVDITKTNAKH